MRRDFRVFQRVARTRTKLQRYPVVGTTKGTGAAAFVASFLFCSARRDEHGQTSPREQSQAKPRTHVRAEAKITVQSSDAKPHDQTASPALMELSLSETFTGDIEGESPVRALQVLRDDHSACLVSMQRFHGKLGGRQGTFVLQGSEIVESGKIKATWSVVPGSGTGDLSGLRGEGGFEGQFGKGSDGTLDYWFEWSSYDRGLVKFRGSLA